MKNWLEKQLSKRSAERLYHDYQKLGDELTELEVKAQALTLPCEHAERVQRRLEVLAAVTTLGGRYRLLGAKIKKPWYKRLAHTLWPPIVED